MLTIAIRKVWLFVLVLSFFILKGYMKKIKETCSLCKRTFIITEDDLCPCGGYICEECLNFLLDEAEETDLN